MANRAQLLLVSAFLSLFFFQTGLCQSAADSLLEDARHAYQELKYEEAEKKARAALSAYESFSPDEITEIHTIIGQIAYSRNDLDAAQRHFEAALRINPDWQLDPTFVSPKILNFFEEIRQKIAPDSTANTAILPPPVLVEDNRTAAALRSLLIPGWGQFYKKENLKGWILTGLWGAASAGAIASHVLMIHADSDSQRGENAGILERDEHTWQIIRNNLILTAAGVWVYSYLDALISNKPSVDEVYHSIPQYNLMLAPASGPPHISLYARIRF